MGAVDHVVGKNVGQMNDVNVSVEVASVTLYDACSQPSIRCTHMIGTRSMRAAMVP